VQPRVGGGVRSTPAGFSGPDTWLNRLLAFISPVALASTCGSFHTGWPNRKTGVVGLAADSGKYLVSRVVPMAESLPEGGLVVPPKPAAE